MHINNAKLTMNKLKEQKNLILKSSPMADAPSAAS